MRTLWLALLFLCAPAFAAEPLSLSAQFAAVTGAEPELAPTGPTCSGSACTAPRIPALPLKALADDTPPDVAAAQKACQADIAAKKWADDVAGINKAALVEIQGKIKKCEGDSRAATEALRGHTADLLAAYRRNGYPIPDNPGPGPAPGPTPTPTPVPPPAPPVPPPAPTSEVTLLLVTSMDQRKVACEPCKTIADAKTADALRASMGNRFTEVDYDSPVASAKFPEIPRIPRWKLTRPDGSTEVKTGVLTLDEVNKWLGGKF